MSESGSLRYLHALSLLLWGFQVNLLWFALPMAIILEARYLLNRRWAITRTDFYRTADLTSVALVGLIIFLFLNRTEYHFIRSLVGWLPIVFFPLVVIIAYSTTERMTLDVLFYSLRRQKEPVTQSWDMNYVFFGICLVAAGTNTHGASYYSVSATMLVLFALFRLRSARYSTNIWLLTACVIFLASIAAHEGLRSGHLVLKEKSRAWLAGYIRDRVNALRTTSAIGSLGQLKLSDSIVMRVQPLNGAPPPRLLQEASYDVPSDNDWMIINPQFSILPHADDFRWQLQDFEKKDLAARIYLEFGADKAIIPVPVSASAIDDLPAEDIRKSKFGTIQASGLVRSPGYLVNYRPGTTLNSPPDNGDVYVPREFTAMLDQVLAPYSGSLDSPLDVVHSIFSDFTYSLYQSSSGNEMPLSHFLTTTKSGHCEYFAGATVLLLRQLGVPARYAVGYSVQEYNSTVDMYLVRKRHAHAWAIAYLNDRWQIVDTTPSIWAANESAEASTLQPMWDLLANSGFLLQLWWNKQKIEDYQVELYIFGAVLALILAYRILTSEQVIINANRSDGQGEGTLHQGWDSPFFLIEQQLVAAGWARAPGETLTVWLQRIDRTELLPLLILHHRSRFHPEGLDQDGQAVLRKQVNDWLRRDLTPVNIADS